MDRGYIGDPYKTGVLRTCPNCQQRLDGATYVGSKPDFTPMKAGDLTICFYCGTLLACTVRGFRAATQYERDHMDPIGRQVLDAWHGRRGKTGHGYRHRTERCARCRAENDL